MDAEQWWANVRFFLFLSPIFLVSCFAKEGEGGSLVFCLYLSNLFIFVIFSFVLNLREWGRKKGKRNYFSLSASSFHSKIAE